MAEQAQEDERGNRGDGKPQRLELGGGAQKVRAGLSGGDFKDICAELTSRFFCGGE